MLLVFVILAITGASLLEEARRVDKRATDYVKMFFPDIVDGALENAGTLSLAEIFELSNMILGKYQLPYVEQFCDILIKHRGADGSVVDGTLSKIILNNVIDMFSSKTEDSINLFVNLYSIYRRYSAKLLDIEILGMLNLVKHLKKALSETDHPVLYTEGIKFFEEKLEIEVGKFPKSPEEIIDINAKVFTRSKFISGRETLHLSLFLAVVFDYPQRTPVIEDFYEFVVTNSPIIFGPGEDEYRQKLFGLLNSLTPKKVTHGLKNAFGKIQRKKLSKSKPKVKSNQDRMDCSGEFCVLKSKP
jgi:hypothetical protein